MNFDDMKLSVEALSGGKNTVLLDDQGMPSIMVRIPRFNLNDVIAGAPNTPHPAFIVNGVVKDEIFISKFQNIVFNDRAYSLPFKDPRTSVTFDQARTFCQNKGNGWHLMTNAEWAAIALWCKRNGFQPRGNNDHGAAQSATYERGSETHKADATRTGRVATGSGPVSWAHDNTNQGIFDLNGNVWEWVGGMRLQGGEIHVIENNNAAIHNIDQGLNAATWRAISAVDGSLLAPGSENTLKYDATGANGTGGIEISTSIINPGDGVLSASRTLETITARSGITVPTIMRALGLAPLDANHGGDNVWMRNVGERLPRRGGAWSFGACAGVFALNLNNERSLAISDLGFRSAYVI